MYQMLTIFFWGGWGAGGVCYRFYFHADLQILIDDSNVQTVFNANSMRNMCIHLKYHMCTIQIREI